MFEKNDKFYWIALKIVKVTVITLCVLAGLCIFAGLMILPGALDSWIPIPIGFGASIVFFLLAGSVYVFGNLCLSKHYDIKVIRDKVCDIKDSQFFVQTKVKVNENGEKIVVSEKVSEEEKAKYKSLLDSGIISEEEYNSKVNG